MASIDSALLQKHQNALEEIMRLLAHSRVVNDWAVPDEVAHYSYELARLAPANAIHEAVKYTQQIKKENQKAADEFNTAIEAKKIIKDTPITDAGRLGIIGFIQRQLLAAINGTPFNGLNRFVVDDKGLQIYRPFAVVSQRTLRYSDLKDGKAVLSVNPPAYFDAILGLLSQFDMTKGVQSPWGQIVAYEPGSGREIGSAVALWPDDKKNQFEVALRTIERAGNRYEGYKRIPSLADVLMNYDCDLWSLELRKIAETGQVSDGQLAQYTLIVEKEPTKKTEKERWKHWPKVNGCLLALVLATGALLWIPLSFLLRPFSGIIAFFTAPFRRIFGIFLPG